MRVIEPSAEILTATDDLEALIERAGRTCYKSEDKITVTSAATFIRSLVARGHESVLEHGAITVRIICDRGVTHELVRHRLASFSQESSRYCSYNKDRFGGEITVIRPLFWSEDSAEYRLWYRAMLNAQNVYLDLTEHGIPAQEARSVLPNSLKTEIVVTANPREWRHIFKLRTAKAAHPQMRQIMIPLANEFALRWSTLFEEFAIQNREGK